MRELPRLSRPRRVLGWRATFWEDAARAWKCRWGFRELGSAFPQLGNSRTGAFFGPVAPVRNKTSPDVVELACLELAVVLW